jgi:hypothetical protein
MKSNPKRATTVSFTNAYALVDAIQALEIDQLIWYKVENLTKDKL